MFTNIITQELFKSLICKISEKYNIDKSELCILLKHNDNRHEGDCCNGIKYGKSVGSKCIVCKTKRSNFSLEGNKASHCKGCATGDMIDVKNTKCIVCKKKQPSFGYPQTSPNYCSKHKLKGMMFNPNKKCYEKKCINKAQYGVKEPYHCELHKKEYELDQCELECKKCGKFDILTHEGLCVNFCEMGDQHEEHKKYQKKDEIRILKKVTDIFGEPTYYDEIVNECFEYRPDIIYDFTTHILIVCVDEKQHNTPSYKECDRPRMINIVSTFGGTPVYFIRYNPDNYRIRGKLMKTSKHIREDKLVSWVIYVKNLKVKDLVYISHVIHLYYDEYDYYDSKFEKLEYKCL